jgi:hypothetical protein
VLSSERLVSGAANPPHDSCDLGREAQALALLERRIGGKAVLHVD